MYQKNVTGSTTLRTSVSWDVCSAVWNAVPNVSIAFCRHINQQFRSSVWRYVLWIRTDSELFGQVGFGSGKIFPDPDLSFLTRKSVTFVAHFSSKCYSSSLITYIFPSKIVKMFLKKVLQQASIYYVNLKNLPII